MRSSLALDGWLAAMLVLGLVATVCGLAAPAAAQPTAYAIEIVARAGDVIGGKTLTNVFTPALNDAGQVAFRGQFAGGFGIFTPDALVAETGQSVGGDTLVTINGPAIRQDGTVVFFGSYSGGSGLFTSAGQFFGAGDVVGAGTVTQVNTLPDLDDAGVPLVRVGFSSGLSALVTPSAIQIAVDQAYGARSVESLLGSVPASINAGGAVAAAVEFDDGSKAIVSQSDVIVAEGDSIEGVAIADLLNNVDLNDAGTVAFSATIAGGVGLFSQDAVLATDGDVIGGRTLENFSAPAINADGVVAFHADYQSGGPRSGLFTLTEQVLAAFETSIGAELVSGFVNDRPALNDAGQIALKASVGSAPAILLVTPVPEPTAAAGLVALATLLRRASRCGRRRTPTSLTPR